MKKIIISAAATFTVMLYLSNEYDKEQKEINKNK